MIVTAGIAAVTTASFLQGSPAKAILYIDFIPISGGTKTRIQASGALDRALLPTGAANTAAGSNTTTWTGINSSRLVVTGFDQLRLTYSPTTVSNPGRRWRISGPADPFTGSSSPLPFFAPPTPTNAPAFILRPINGQASLGGQDFWLPDTYVSKTPFNGSFDVNATLAAIGLLNGNVVYDIGDEQIILRQTTVVPGPLPVLGAAAAFGYSRKLRKRINQSQRKQVA